MNNWKWAYNELKEGTKLRKLEWETNQYIYIKDGMIIDQDNQPFYITVSDFDYDQWRVWRQKFYLSELAKNDCFLLVNGEDVDKEPCMLVEIPFILPNEGMYYVKEGRVYSISSEYTKKQEVVKLDGMMPKWIRKRVHKAQS